MPSVSGTSICTDSTCSRSQYAADGAVGEAEHVQILGGFLAQEMVDPVHLLLIQDRMNDPVEFAEAAGRGAKRLLVDDPGAMGQPVPPQRLGQPAEGDRRDGQVVHQLRAARRAMRAPAPSTSGKLPGLSELNPPPAKNTRCANESQSVALGLGAELGERIVDAGAEVLVRDVAAAVAYQQPLPGQQPLARQPVKSRQHHPPGQVTGRPEQDENRRPCRRIWLLHRGHHASKLHSRPGPPGPPFLLAEPLPAGSGLAAAPVAPIPRSTAGWPETPRNYIRPARAAVWLDEEIIWRESRPGPFRIKGEH